MELVSTHICKGKNVGVHGNLFGGTLLSWIDEAAGAYAAQCCDTPRMVTKSMSRVVFEKPIRPGQVIKVYGEVKKIGNTSITIEIEVRRHSVYDGVQKLVCFTDITFVRIDGDGEPVPLSERIKKKYLNNKYPSEDTAT
tara:strand:+ start:454 stop:870 length:417 start_codon:yes stop_codon:yes gene_type:complete